MKTILMLPDGRTVTLESGAGGATAYDAERGSPAWIEAWAALEAELGDTVARDPHSGECWQYMGTELHGDRWMHCFRHRALYGEERVCRHYPATPPAGGKR